MAVTKTFRAPESGSIYGSRYMSLKIEEENVDNTTNTSDVKWTLTVAGDSTYYDTGVQITINGEQVYSKEVYWYGGFPAQPGSTSGYVRNIQHDDATGEKQITVVFRAYVYNYSYTNYGGTVDLSVIPRGSKINTSTTKWLSTTTDGGIKVGITKYNNAFYHKLTIKALNVSSQSYTTLKTVNNIDDGDNVTFTSSELNTLYTNSLPSQQGSIRLELRTYSDSGLTTQVGTTSTYDMVKSLAIVAPTFSDFDYSDTNTNATTGTTRLTNDNQTIIKGYSTLTVSIPTNKKATANTRQTTISHYVVDGETLAYSSSATVSKSFAKYNKDNISVFAVDARSSASAVVNKSFTSLNKFVNYTDVVKDDNQSYSRSNSGVGEFVTLSFSGSWWGNRKFGTNGSAVTNSLTATYKYRISGASSWTTPSSPTLTLTLSKAQQSDTYYTKFSFNNTVNGDLVSNGFNVSNSYDILVTVKDQLSTVEYSFSIHAGEPAIALYKNKAALGAAYNETLGGTQFWGNTYLNGVALSTTNWDTIYPVGSIYMTVDATQNPNTMFTGTTWQRIKDKFLLAAGDTYTNGGTGGSATVTLSSNQLPAHNHWERIVGDDGSSNSYVRAAGTGSNQGVYFHGQSAWVSSTGQPVVTDDTGGGQAHDNMPPYLVVCVWKRTQ